MRVRKWPFLASLNVLLFVLVLVYGLDDPFSRLGTPTLISISVMLLSISFSILAIYSFYVAIQERQAEMNRAAYWHSAVLSGLHFISMLYLLWFGVIGIRTWG